jgi:hypothetical protein
MTPVSHELNVFATPWHWFVHGLGMGQNRTGFDAARAARIRELARTVAHHRAGPFPAFVVELVDIILAAGDPADGGEPGGAACARLAERISGLSDARDHARACAAATESLVKLGSLPPGDHALRRALAGARDRIAALPGSTDQARYGNLQLLVNLVVAGAQAGWPEALGPAQLDAAARLLAPIDDFFYRARGLSMWQTVVAVVEPRARAAAGAALRQLLDQLDLQLQRPADRPGDGVHEGRDYLVFALLLTLAALGPVRRLDLLDHRRRWLDVAAAELAALSPRAQASQILFHVAVLRNLGALAREVPDPAGLVRATAVRYLATTDGCQLDDYLRCTYLVHLARQLGCPAVLPGRIGAILADSPTQLDTAGPFRATPYGSPLLLVAYVLSALHAGSWPTGHALCAVDLASVIRCAPPRSDDAVNLPRLGLALIDAALCLAPPSRRDTALFAAAAAPDSASSRSAIAG